METKDALQRVKANGSMVLLVHINAHIGDDTSLLKGVKSQHNEDYLNDN